MFRVIKMHVIMSMLGKMHAKPPMNFKAHVLFLKMQRVVEMGKINLQLGK